ncbi:MAG: hypothetical protein EPN91_08860 [Salinibacterium sp.]|nr:MAG: hypothetical protein EPN91_08860 [Salinibacterium sp.]
MSNEYIAKLVDDLHAERIRNGELATRITELESKLAERGLNGSLLLDYETVRTSPVYFSLQALLFRAAGMKVTAVGVAGDEKLHAAANVAMTDFRLVPHSPQERALAKFTIAMQLLKDGAVIWPDLDFTRWDARMPNVNNVPGLVILDWTRVLRGGLKPDKVGIV